MTGDHSFEALIEATVAKAVDQALERHHGVERVAYSVVEAAESLGVSPDIVRRLIRDGALPVLDLGVRRQLVPVVALRRFVEVAGERERFSRRGAA